MTEIADLSGILMAEPVTAFLSNLAAAIAAIVITLFASRFVKSWIAKLGFRYEQLDDTLFVFLSKFAQVVVLAVGSVFVLNSFGVQTTSIVALLGAAGLAVGLALQGTLSNFAAGIMLIVFRPFKRGDYVSVSGQSGTVKEISIFTTELGTPDNLQIIVPQWPSLGRSDHEFFCLWNTAIGCDLWRCLCQRFKTGRRGVGAGYRCR
jgi:small conductance mechanosensitive channel